MISQQLKQVILEQLDLDDFELDETTLACDVPGWDSLSHVAVLCAVEAAFGIRFRTIETLRLKNIGDLQALVDKRLSGS